MQDEFEQIQTVIECTCSDDKLDEHLKYRDDFTNILLSTQAHAYTISDNFKLSKQLNQSLTITTEKDSQSERNANVGGNVVQNNSFHNNTINQIKLPTIELPKFKGNYNDWLEFRDTFLSLIHNNAQINTIQKFHYLRASLENNALKIIQSLEFSSDNYEKAWELLCKRYNKTHLLVHSHLKAIFELDVITRENAASLRAIIDSVLEHLYALNTLKQPTDHWDQILIYTITSKLDRATLREWDNFRSTEDFPSFKDFLEFLSKRADALETFDTNHNRNSQTNRLNNNTKRTAMIGSTSLKCNYCRKAHSIYHCQEFLELSANDRIQQVTALNLCKNCLCLGHYATNCRSGVCKKCKSKHNTLLYVDKQQHPSVKHESSSPATQISLSTYSLDKFVLLSTALIQVSNTSSKGSCVSRALLDSGSQINFISLKLCKQLNLKQIPVDISVVGINKMSSSLKTKCNVTISSLHNKSMYTITCYVLPKITDNLPSETININSWNIPEHTALADPEFNVSGEIELLLGAEIFWQVIYKQMFKLGRDLPTLRHTAFGWIVCGSLNQSSQTAVCNFVRSDPMNLDLKRFWELEEINTTKTMTSDDEYCERHFTSNVTRADDGRFMVRLPLKHSPTLLGNSQEQALKRLIKVENKIIKSTELKTQYTAFMQEYIDLGHMSLITKDDNVSPSYFLPHHSVVKRDSLTTRLRVVFDGSASSDSGWSLNDIQHVGPTIINDIFEILLRIRQYKFLVMADIAKMYRQIWIHPDDRQLQRILWRNEQHQQPQIYNLNTVTYGTSSAPYLAIRCLQQTAYENQQEFPKAADVILHNFYVDDMITGFSSEGEAVETCQQISYILSKYNFSLRKWHSNSEYITNHLFHDDEPLSSLPLGTDEVKTLGVHWNNKRDTLTYKALNIHHGQSITKRTILSTISKIFDPLGLISPLVIVTNILIQKLWTSNLTWDDPIPADLRNEWLAICTDLHLLSNIQVPRFILLPEPTSIELIGFCDASKDAYACCIYIRSVDESSNINSHLLCSKTKVAPLKLLTIPRLELCSATLLAELMQKVSGILSIKHDISYWTDSKIVLAWLKKDAKQLQTFVGNRIAKIQNLTNIDKWYHVASTNNPADVASRGVSPKCLIASKLWWHGAPFLSLPRGEWPISELGDIPQVIPEIKKKFATFVNVSSNIFPFQNYSSYNKLKRIIAYCLRFIANSKLPSASRKLGFLQTEELQNANIVLIKWAQEESFAREMAAFKPNSNLNFKSNLLSLTPFMDKDGLLRVGGRLKNSGNSYNHNHPILLSGKHHLVKLIMEEEHKRLLHIGPQQLLNHIRQQVWPTSGLQLAKRVVRKCITCFKFKPKIQFPIMGDLPRERITPSFPFFNTGVDFAGPFLLRDRNGRGSKLSKAWICMFICFATKAIHIDLVTSLSTNAFMACFRRFVARRGKPSKLFSDNGTNFIGACNQLKDFYKRFQSDIAPACAYEGVQWNFIPPQAPHFGGLWESGIRSIKRHLLKVITNVSLTFEEFLTVLTQIEATLNSRPLSPLSTDPNDLSPLTPAHFLIGRALVGLPEPQVLTTPMNRLTRFQLLQQLYQCFWSRWSKEYLHHLQQRTKWKLSSPANTIGTLVLIKDDHLPPCHWRLGRILELHPGDDGVTRVVTVKTAGGTIKRPVTKICPLPIEEETTENNSQT